MFPRVPPCASPVLREPYRKKQEYKVGRTPHLNVHQIFVCVDC